MGVYAVGREDYDEVLAKLAGSSDNWPFFFINEHVQSHSVLPNQS